MATLMAYGGNFTDASSWGLCSSIAAHDSESSNTVVTTSYLSGADFMPGAITIDGIAVKPRSITPNTGNITVALQSSGLIISGTVVTLNISNLPSGIGATSAPDYGWILFRFTGNQTLTDGLNYKVQARTSNASIVTLYSSGTNNWARQLRTTTNQSPTTGDKLIIVGEWSGQNSGKNVSINMNYNGSGSGIGSIWVSRSGILNWETGANTYLPITGNSIDGTFRGIELCAYGTMNIGTSGAPINSGYNAIVEFCPTTNVAFGKE
jgi:hypothetical protein